MDRQQEALLILLRRAVWGVDLQLESAVWDDVELIATQQGVRWALYPGAKSLAADISKDKLQEWRRFSLAGVWNNESLNEFQGALLEALVREGIRTVILKGTSCSRYYTSPEMRFLGDIDIQVDPENVDAVANYLRGLGFVESKAPHGFHRGFSMGKITVEVHYHCTELPQGKGTDAAMNEEKRFLEQTRMAEMNGMHFPVLSEKHQALMLLMHMERHMQEDGIGLKQLCDWATFVDGAGAEHWTETLQLLESCGLFQYAKVVTKVCIRYLGLKCETTEWANDISDKQADVFMSDVFCRGSFGNADNQKSSSLFSDRSTMGEKEQSMCRGMAGKMKKIVDQRYPVARKYKTLECFFYVYIPLKYIIQSIFKRKRNPMREILDSRKRQRLYHSLHLYEVEE